MLTTYFSGRLLGAESLSSEQSYARPHEAPTSAPPQGLAETLRSVLPPDVLDALPQGSMASPLNVPAGVLSDSAGLAAALEVAVTGDKVADLITEGNILDGARKAGLDGDEVATLKQILESSPDFQSDARLLEHVLGGVNSDRALRTFMDLDSQRRAHPDRITSDVIATLVNGVAQPREGYSQEGVLSQDTADRAAKALVEMPQADYDAIQGVLKQAGVGSNPASSDAGTERALILKAVGAREKAYAHPSVVDRVVKPTMLETQDVVAFANTIRGVGQGTLFYNTTVTCGYDDLTQRWGNSCTPATAQMLKAEADPIYAWKLHGEMVGGGGTDGFIGQEQARLLKDVGQMVIPFEMFQQLGQLAHSGNPAVAHLAEKMLERMEGMGSRNEDVDEILASDATGRDFHGAKVSDDVTSRTIAVDCLEAEVRRGEDVPIGIEWTNRSWMNPLKSVDAGFGHSVLVTDVRGHGDDAVFTIADPGTGSTYEVSRKDLIAGNTQFGDDGRGRLASYTW